MKKIFIIYFVSLFVYHNVYAQIATSQQFNELKRSQKYFYSEVTLPNKDDAKIVALANLLKLINDSLEVIKNNTIIESQDLEKNVLYLEMNRDGGIRILAYVDKSYYLEDTPQNDTNNEDLVLSQVIETSEEKNIDDKQDNNNGLSNMSTAVENNIENSSLNNIKKEVSQQIHNDNFEPESEWVSNSINILIKKQNLTDFCDELSLMNGQHKIKRYSSLQQCKDVTNSYLAIFDKDNCLMAVLNPSMDKRYNFLTHDTNTLEEYLTQTDLSIICFQFSK